MRSILRFVFDELGGRLRESFAMTGLIALITLLAATIVLLLAERERAVTLTMDRADLPLVVVPRGVSATERQRFDFDLTLPAPLVASIRAALGSRIRVFEPRRTVLIERAGKKIPLIGLDPEAQRRTLGRALQPREALPGFLAVSALGGGQEVDRSIDWHGVHWVWDHSLPEQGVPEDRAVFLRISDLQNALGSTDFSELHLSPAAGHSADSVASLLREGFPAIAVQASPVRGSIAEKETVDLLGRARSLVHGVTIGLLAIAAAAWGFLDIRRRRRESTILTAMGASPAWLIAVFTTRALLLGGLAGLLGTAAPALWLGLSGSAEIIPWMSTDLFGLALASAAVPALATAGVVLWHVARGRLLIPELQPVH